MILLYLWADCGQIGNATIVTRQFVELNVGQSPDHTSRV